MKKRRIELQDIVPFIAFIVIFMFFEIVSEGKMLSPMNLGNLVDQSVLTIVAGCGAIFVVAQGSIDLTIGVNLALSGVIATWVAGAVGGWLLIPVALIVGTLVGVFNGVIVSKCKVPSFMLSISMLIGVRGIVNYIQTFVGIQYIPDFITALNNTYVKYVAFIAIIVIMAYVFEFTKIGKYSKAIGENETAAKSVGVPVTLTKIVAFAISGLLAGGAAIFSLASFGGTHMQMGVFFEMKVAMALFLGGVLVTGGNSAKIYKVLLGSFSITIIVNGLALIGLAESQYSQTVEGLLLLLILFMTILASRKSGRTHKTLSDEAERKQLKT